jgi:hypothetical protein
MTEGSFERISEECVFKPLLLKHTSIRQPADNLGVVPNGDSMWSYDIGDEGP